VQEVEVLTLLANCPQIVKFYGSCGAGGKHFILLERLQTVQPIIDCPVDGKVKSTQSFQDGYFWILFL
jgi:hypothetical protein